MKKYSLYIWLLFIVLSALGVFLFITPINTADGIKVPIAMLANWLYGIVEPVIQWFTFIVFIIAALGSLIIKASSRDNKKPPTMMDSLFRVNWFWTIMRVLAVVFAAMYLFQFGPSAVNSDVTAGILLDSSWRFSHIHVHFILICRSFTAVINRFRFT